MSETIYALSTAAGKGAVAVIRVSGEKALEGLKLLSGLSSPVPRMANLCKLVDPVSRETIDNALVVYFKSPSSFTGEDVVEYYLHGGRAVVKSMLSALCAIDGYRMAEAGEFTKRAFENGKVDLTEAEAIADLVDAETQMQKNQALSQLSGSLSRLYEKWNDELKNSLALLEADLDFSDEDLPDGYNSEIIPVLEKLIDDISNHLEDNHKGERLRDGIDVVIIGAPNAGKSSLINALARRDVAIVSEMAGTTRDIIEVHLDLGGYPVILADTAGLRPDQISDEGYEAIESEGIKRALARAEKADIKLLLFDGTSLPDIDLHTVELADENSLFAVNKIDLYEGTVPAINGQRPICISVKENDGIDKLLSELLAKIENYIGEISLDSPTLTRQRHRESLEKCKEHLERSLNAEMPELMTEDVRLAMRELGRITGKVDVEDLLDIIFSSFCIGK